jgi:hypothetical protein
MAGMKNIAKLFFVIVFCVDVLYAQPIQVRETLYQIQEVPTYPELSGDSLYWVLVQQGLDIVPELIDCMDISDATDIQGFVYSPTMDITAVGDIAWKVLHEIIKGIPVQDFLAVSKMVENFDNISTYAINERQKLRVFLKKQTKKWYKTAKHHLEWVPDANHYKTAEDWKFPTDKHPAGGYYLYRDPRTIVFKYISPTDTFLVSDYDIRKIEQFWSNTNYYFNESALQKLEEASIDLGYMFYYDKAVRKWFFLQPVRYQDSYIPYGYHVTTFQQSFLCQDKNLIEYAPMYYKYLSLGERIPCQTKTIRPKKCQRIVCQYYKEHHLPAPSRSR